MMRTAILLAGLSPLVLATPVAAQSGHGAHHAPQQAAVQPPAPACTAEHAAMGHCTMEPSAAGAGHDGHREQGGAKPLPPASDPSCPPEHAAMGHCTPKVAVPLPPGGGEGTDLPPGNAPAPPPPADWYADRIFPGAAMAHARHMMMVENGGQTFGFVSLDLEYRPRGDGYGWDGEVWYGGDIHRLTIKSAGEGAFGEGVEAAEAQLLYSRAIGPYFNAQAGVRQDFGLGPDRTYAVIGFEGLAPYWFEVEGALFLSGKGDVLARLEAEYDQRITQRLILQPAAGIGFALQDVPASGTGSGLKRSSWDCGCDTRSCANSRPISASNGPASSAAPPASRARRARMPKASVW